MAPTNPTPTVEPCQLCGDPIKGTVANVLIARSVPPARLCRSCKNQLDQAQARWPF